MFCTYLRKNNEVFPIQYYLTAFYNRGDECLLRRTNWVLKQNRLDFALKCLTVLLYSPYLLTYYMEQSPS